MGMIRSSGEDEVIKPEDLTDVERQVAGAYAGGTEIDLTGQSVRGEVLTGLLTGMYRVAEARLAELEAVVLKELVQKGVLGRIYTHLLSLDNFQRLLGRRSAAVKAVAAEKPAAKKLN